MRLLQRQSQRVHNQLALQQAGQSRRSTRLLELETFCLLFGCRPASEGRFNCGSRACACQQAELAELQALT